MEINQKFSMVYGIVLASMAWLTIPTLKNSEASTSFLDKTEQRLYYSKGDMFCLAKNIYHEAGFESDLGKYAVAQVTINRMQDDRWPKTVCDVVWEPKQFSWTADVKIKWTHPRGEMWERSKQIAEEVLSNGVRVIPLQSALYFHADYVRPRWASEAYKVARIDNHIFYSDIKK